MCGRCSICRRPLRPKVPGQDGHDAPGRDSAYDRAFSFWRLLAETSAPVGPSKALVNTAAPFVLSNALWYPEPESIAELNEVYAEQDVSPSCFLSAVLDAELYQTLALSNAGFSRVAQYGFNTVSGSTQSDLAVEQVSWAQTRSLGEVIAAVYDLERYAVAVGQTLALALQLEPALIAFIAYDEKPVGAMVTRTEPGAVTAYVLEALSPAADAALRARLAFEAQTQGKQAQVFEPTETGAFELWR